MDLVRIISVGDGGLSQNSSLQNTNLNYAVMNFFYLSKEVALIVEVGRKSCNGGSEHVLLYNLDRVFLCLDIGKYGIRAEWKVWQYVLCELISLTYALA